MAIEKRSDKTTMFSMRMETPVYAALKKMAEKSDRTMSKCIHMIVKASITVPAKTGRAAK
jgi:hypothetical protein